MMFQFILEVIQAPFRALFIALGIWFILIPSLLKDITASTITYLLLLGLWLVLTPAAIPAWYIVNTIEEIYTAWITYKSLG